MKRSGAEAEIIARLLQYDFFKRCNNNPECLVRNGIPKKGCKAAIGLHGKQRIGAQFQQSTSGGSCPSANLECDCVGCEATSLAEDIKDPLGICGLRGVISARIAAECFATKGQVDERFSHSEAPHGLAKSH